MANKQVRIGFYKADVFRETEKAYGIRIEGKDAFYLPKSQISDWQEDSDRYYAYVPLWLIEQNGVDELIDSSNEPTLF